MCETNILNNGVLAFFPKNLIYFTLGMFYGLVPIFLSAICFSRPAEKNPIFMGLVAGSIFAAFLIPFFLVHCPEFTSGLIVTMALGMFAGSVTGGTGTLWVLSRMRAGVS
ncbi:MAG: hypothetical protein JRH18_21065 [Deltaproteobacteria bacterium]|nr:hypothetical protein [Deltaproteobacteria bacterium]MBW2154143.1 hypothetical protein [Deltaproteobacteria bacterium]